MSSDLQRVAQGLIDALDQNPRAAAELNYTANQCMELAAQIAELAVILPEAAVAAEYLAQAARDCGEAAQLVASATVVGRTWAVDAVGAAAGASPDAPVARDAIAGNAQPRRPAPKDDSAERGSIDQRERRGPRIKGGQRDAMDEDAEGERESPAPLNVPEILARLPVRETAGRRRAKTRGIWVDTSGEEREIVSGQDEYQLKAAAWVKERGLGPPPHTLLIDSHVEVKFAMLMREQQLVDETIVINSPPCPGDWGCDQMLEAFLPPGASLTVHAPAFSKTYRGKGLAE